MSRGSLRLRLFFAGSISIVVALALAAAGLSELFKRHVERRVVAELHTDLDQLVAGLGVTSAGKLEVTRPLADPRFNRPLSGLYWQIDESGSPLRSRSLWDTELTLPPDALSDVEVHVHRLSGPGDSELIAVERRILLPANLGGGSVRAAVAVNAEDVAKATRAFASDLLPYLALVTVLLVAAAWTQIVVGLRPLAAVRDRLAAIRSGKDRRLGADFPDEVQPLAAEVDLLLESQEHQLARARARAADLAHGLKTPLQVLEGDAERLRQKGETQIAEEIAQTADAMRRHVERELARARLAGAIRHAEADLLKVTDRVLAVIRRTPDSDRITWTTKVPPGLVARIDPDDLAELAGNLLENAGRHATSGVTVEGTRDGGEIVFSVSDDGPGIPEERLQEALARGGRLDTAGTGLGLAIVQDIAEACGAGFAVRHLKPGLGIVLRFAAADRPAQGERQG